uniref:Uncharacterized protein n=1 Tax=Rhizophora mucronata TaxID=61149 RepID=A0A2P2PR18_RHIMU
MEGGKDSSKRKYVWFRHFLAILEMNAFDEAVHHCMLQPVI